MPDLATVCHMINRTPLDLTVRELVWRLRNHISIAMPQPTQAEADRKTRWRLRYWPTKDLLESPHE